MKATEKQMARMTEEVEAINEDITAVQGGASLKSMGVPKGVNREEAIQGWAARRDAIQAAMDEGRWFAM